MILAEIGVFQRAPEAGIPFASLDELRHLGATCADWEVTHGARGAAQAPVAPDLQLQHSSDVKAAALQERAWHGCLACASLRAY